MSRTPQIPLTRTHYIQSELSIYSLPLILFSLSIRFVEHICRQIEFYYREATAVAVAVAVVVAAAT